MQAQVGISYDPAAVEQSVPACFEAAAARYPDRPAVQRQDQVFTYDALNRAANRLAHAILAERGPCPEPVTILLEQSPAAIIAILGILKAGKIYVPLDRSHPPARQAIILDDSQATLLVTNRRNLAAAEALAGARLPRLALDALSPILPETNPAVAIAPDPLLNIMYTSGSTGRPKGAIQTHRNLLHAVFASFEYSPRSCEDRFLLLTSYSFGASAFSIFTTLLSGGTLVIYSLREDGIDRLADCFTREAITHVHAVPTVFRHLLATLAPDQRFPAMRHVALGGDPVYRRDVELFWQHFPQTCVLRNGFGTTENYLATRLLLYDNSPVTSSIIPVGYPVRENRILILGPTGEQLGPGEVGEIAFQSSFLSPGYWNQSELTKLVYRPDRAGGNARLYLTGDLGRLRPDGCLEHLGRKDSQAKIRGHRVEPGEVEAALLECPGVQEAVVVGVEQQPGDLSLVAYLVPSVQPPPTTGDLLAALAARLPDTMIPSAFVVLDRLPMLPFGKVDVSALPAPDRSRPPLATSFVPPGTPMEQALARIWSEILGREPIGIHDNFFELGGHSLAAAQLAGRVRQELQVDLAVRTVFEAPTVAALAAHIAADGQVPLDPTALERALHLLGPV